MAMMSHVSFTACSPVPSCDWHIPLVPDGHSVAGAELLAAVLEEVGRAGDDATGQGATAIAINLK